MASRPEFYSVAEAAAVLKLSAARVRLLCAQGRIKAQRIGRAWIIRPADLWAFQRKPRRPGRPPAAK